MSTEALVTMLIAWGYVLGMLIYLFTKLIRKERGRKGAREEGMGTRR
jgi:hypothetical protein